MKCVSVPKFVTPYGVVEFVPVDDVSGHTHRISVDGRLQRLWCPQGKHPGKHLAQFFIRVYCAQQEGLPPYHYVDRKEDPPLPGKTTQQHPVHAPVPEGGPQL